MHEYGIFKHTYSNGIVRFFSVCKKCGTIETNGGIEHQTCSGKMHKNCTVKLLGMEEVEDVQICKGVEISWLSSIKGKLTKLKGRVVSDPVGDCFNAVGKCLKGLEYQDKLMTYDKSISFA